MQGETSFYYKLFLHVLYEIESTIYFFKDVVLSEQDKLGELLKREVSKERRKFEKIYYELNLSAQFEKLLDWYEERTVQIQGSNDSLKLIYNVRRAFFSIYDRENEYALYLMRLAKLHRQMHAKTKQGVLLVNSLFK
jgi:trehalose/maltose hydrolase-like predicted phosphorylase